MILDPGLKNNSNNHYEHTTKGYSTFSTGGDDHLAAQHRRALDLEKVRDVVLQDYPTTSASTDGGGAKML
jgi:hypothetical protein